MPSPSEEDLNPFLVLAEDYEEFVVDPGRWILRAWIQVHREPDPIKRFIAAFSAIAKINGCVRTGLRPEVHAKWENGILHIAFVRDLYE